MSFFRKIKRSVLNSLITSLTRVRDAEKKKKKRRKKAEVSKKKRVRPTAKKEKMVKRPKKKALKKIKKKKSPPRTAPKKAPEIKEKPQPLKIGEITHYFAKVDAGVIKIQRGALFVGDKILIKGPSTDILQKVKSLQINRIPVDSANKGEEVGLEVKKKVRVGDEVFKIK